MKRNALKSIAAFALGTVMLGSLAACGGNNPNDYAEYDENGNLILTIWAPDQYAGSQVRAQFQIEGKLLFGEPFKDGEHPTTLSRVQKIVGVLNAACNRLKRQKLPDVEVGEPGAHVLRRQCRKDGHDPNYQLNSMNFGVSSVERGSAPGRLSTGRSLRFFIV